MQKQPYRIRNKYAWQRAVSITVMVAAVLGTLLYPSRRVSLLISLVPVFLVAGVYGLMKNRIRRGQVPK